MLKSTVLSLGVAAVLVAAGTARADTVSANRDTYVRANNKGPYGTEAHISVTANKADSEVRKGLIGFSMAKGSVNSAVDAKLDLTVSEWDGKDASATFLVYGLRDVWAALGDAAFCFAENNFTENYKYNHEYLSFLDGSDGGVVANTPCVFDRRPLGTLTVTKDKLGKTVSFSNHALLRFLQEDANGIVSFLLVRSATDKGGSRVGFASREHGSLPAPRLTWTKSRGIELADMSGATVTNGGKTVAYRGELRIPVASGATVTVPGADVSMTFDAAGDLLTLSGTVGFPTLPDQGLLSRLGSGESTGPSLQIGYDYAAAFNGTAQLPLSPTTKYFYFRERSGASVTFGPISASSPDAGETLIALDTLAPALLFHSDQLGGSVVLDSVRLGVSGRNTIPFSPSVTRWVESYMTSFDGDLYIGGSGSIPTSIPGLFVTVDGALTADTNVAAFPTGNWARTIGGNVDTGIEASVGVFAVSFPVGQASLLYRAQGEGGWPSFAFSGEAWLPKFPGMPFRMEGKAKAAGYITGHDSGRASFIRVEGKFRPGTGFVKHDLEGTLVLGGTQGSFSGKATFGGKKMSVSGDVTASHVKLTGSMSDSFNFQAGKIKVAISATFDTRGSGEVSVGASAKYCDSTFGAGCVGASVDEVTVQSNGSVRVCVKIKDVGRTCQTL